MADYSSNHFLTYFLKTLRLTELPPKTLSSPIHIIRILDLLLGPGCKRLRKESYQDLMEIVTREGIALWLISSKILPDRSLTQLRLTDTSPGIDAIVSVCYGLAPSESPRYPPSMEVYLPNNHVSSGETTAPGQIVLIKELLETERKNLMASLRLLRKLEQQIARLEKYLLNEPRKKSSHSRKK